ncbi:KRAB-A domain-containing protein 2-like [Rhopalosiphum padi]|uniref:KRAB-A domain-containing protein 2-like n=1 Tax=Rhopalosiphum padi TaxID=40932 RepID=UPI00298E5678|nr:KRAB-A domain-containing protein 2-like [Rhopalosiphum padi]
MKKSNSSTRRSICSGDTTKYPTGKKERRDYYLIKTYDVLCVTDQKFLIYKKTDEDEDIRYVVPYEELYDRIKDFHIKTGHGGIVKLRMSMGHKYKILRPAIEKFLSVCAICNSKQGANRKLVIKPIVTKDFNERGQVDLVDFQSTPDGKYKWIMNYQDHNTKFLLLHPLESKRAIEVANKLLTIFLTFGAPKILQSDNGREFVNSIIKELKDLWPQCTIVHGRPRHPQSQGSVERSNQDIENMIRAWMKDNQSKKWSVGLQFVQFQKNSSFHRIIGRSPYKALFGCDPKIGLSSSNLPSEIIKKLTTEEHLEEILNNIQPEHEKEQITSYCSICNTEMLTEVEFAETIICDLCKTSEKINKQRQLGYQGQEKAAEIMLKVSQTRVPDLQIGDCVLITVPKVDRGPSDPANVIAVIVNQNEHKLHQLGTQYGLVKG